MADKKISQLDASTTPLAGTEVLPIVQSGVTKKVSVADLTAGRSVAMSGYTVTNTATDVDVLIRNLTTTGTSGETTGISFDVANNAAGVRIYARRDGTYGSTATRDASFRVATTLNSVESEKFVFTSDGNLELLDGDLVIGTAGKGINFSGGVLWRTGTGSPEGVVTASVGSMYTDVAGGAGTTLYVKESGSGNTGWVAK